MVLVLSGCATAAGSSLSDGGPRFRDPGSILTEKTNVTLGTPAYRPPLTYPEELRARGITGDIVVAFVVDTVGRVEMSTVSFVATAEPEFHDVVCEHLRAFRVTPTTRDGRPQRVLAIMPYRFSLDGPAPGSIPQLASYRRFLNEAAPDVVFADLERRPHC